ncbi:hypothetical protein HD806DRAFT_530734 [Xylariaceae sp. AK1471]|nr:hypothetical protein HD806DRAFT_530734 [Xylariaceae sp. AK1471]
MRTTTAEDRIEIAGCLLGKLGSFKAYFKVYDNIARREDDFILQVEHFNQETPLSHQHTSHGIQHKYQTRYQPRSSLYADGGHKGQRLSWSGLHIGWTTTDLLVRQRVAPTICERHVSNSKQRSDKAKIAVDEHALMRAWKLQKRLGLKFKATDSLAEHLLFDHNYIYIFHHTSFLKAQLEDFTREDSPLDLDLTHTLPRGKLPPQLLVETLHSLQAVIFPPVDERSGRILQDLIKKEGFDEDCAHYEGYKLFHETPEGFQYLYWGERVAALHQQLTATPQNRPRNKLERWLERNSSERNALIVALVALLITLVTGIISVLLGTIQVWITYQAWKYPTI